jgi:conjugative relaxase-like TrwC/TraI family protein
MRPTAIRGSNAVDYYTALVPDEADEGEWAAAKEDGEGRVEDYYLPIGEAAGEWWGAGTDALGLSGAGTRGQMAALLDGRDPQTGEPLGQRPRPDGVRAFDLTFSAPKTVSVLLGLLGGQAERAGLAAHDAAVRAALGVLEERATTRAGKNGVERLDTAGLTVLLVRHRTSRALDPQLHTHALVFAKVQGPDGRWRALDARIVFRAQRTFGAVYQSALRSELTRALGVQWGEVSKGQAEIKDLAELVDVFSTRREQIDVRFAEKLADWRAAHPDREPSAGECSMLRKHAAVESRPAKDRARMADELRAEWLDTAREHGWDARRVRDTVLGRQPMRELSPAAARGEAAAITTAAVKKLASSRSVWSLEQLEREIAFRLPTDLGCSAKQQARAIEQLANDAADGLCIDLADLAVAPAARARGLLADAGLERYTTRELLEQEQRIARWFERAAADAGRPASDEQVGRGLAKLAVRDGTAPALDPQQARAAALAAGTQRAVVIVGPAGAGKTTTLQVAVEALRDEGRRVVGLAPTAVAAKRLGEATGVPCENVARYLAQYDDPDRRRHELILRPGDTLLIDEAAMLSTPDYERLLAVADRDGLRLVLVGDPRQLAAVGRGGMFDHARHLLPSVELDEIHRFHSDWEAAASLALRAGDPAAIDIYEAHSRVRYGTAAEMTEAMLTDWWHAWQHNESHAFSAPTNEQVRYLNARAQETRLAAGELQAGGRALRNAHDELITTGDVVATRQNAPQLRLPDGDHVRNRDTWTVTNVAPDGELTLRSHAGAQVAIPVAYAKQHVELAYFRTAHGVQGVTERIGGTLIDETAGLRCVYVGMTRGRHSNTAYVITEPDQDGREVLERALRRDRADLGALAQAKAIADATRREQERREREQIRDPLHWERSALGPERAAALAEHTAPRPDLERLTDSQLREWREQLAAQAVPLDRPAAINVARLEERRRHLEGSLTAAESRVATWRAALDNAPRRARAARARELDKHLHTQATLGEQLDQLNRELHAALTGPDSPDGWLKHHGATNAQLAQVTVELEHRRRRELDRVAQLAITRPPAFITEALGERPTRQAEARRWEHTARALARWQTEHAYDPEHHGPLGPRPAGRNDAARWERLALEIADTTGRELPGHSIEHEL